VFQRGGEKIKEIRSKANQEDLFEGGGITNRGGGAVGRRKCRGTRKRRSSSEGRDQKPLLRGKNEEGTKYCYPIPKK